MGARGEGSRTPVGNSSRSIVTGLPGRPWFFERLDEEVARARRHSRPLSVILLETDNLDATVAGNGPEAPRDLMVHLGVGLTRALRASDGVFLYDTRLVGVILPETNIASAHKVAARALELVSSIGYGPGGITLSLDGGPGELSASLGVAELDPSATSRTLAGKAEEALKLARESGGGMAWRADDPRRTGLGAEALAASLTPREWTVLSHLAGRATEQQIAAQLGIRAGTVRSHKARIRRKLNVAPNARLSEFAREHLSELVKRESPARPQGPPI